MKEPKPKPHMDLLGVYSDGFDSATQKELLECLASGRIYIPYVPLQITRIRPKRR